MAFNIHGITASSLPFFVFLFLSSFVPLRLRDFALNATRYFFSCFFFSSASFTSLASGIEW